MKREYEGHSLVYGSNFTLNLEALPHRFRVRDLSAQDAEEPMRDTLRRWYWLGTAGVALALLVWLGN